MDVSKAGLEFLKNEESFRAESYQDIAGIWSIGYGTTRLNNIPVEPGMMINMKVGIALLHGYVGPLVNYLRKFTLNQNQLDALVSFGYNVGLGALQSSTIINQFKAGKEIKEEYFTRWNKVNGKVVDGLTARRKREFALFMS